MAFSTQKDFLKFGFLNDPLQLNFDQSLVKKLSSYDSCMDPRSWIVDRETQANYLSDLVACSRHGGGGNCEGGSELAPATCEEKLREAERKICQLEKENRALKRLAAQSGTGDASLAAEIERLRLIEQKCRVLKEELDQLQKNCTCGGKKLFCDMKNQQLLQDDKSKTLDQ